MTSSRHNLLQTRNGGDSDSAESGGMVRSDWTGRISQVQQMDCEWI